MKKNLVTMIVISLILNITAIVCAEDRGNEGFGFGTSFHKHQESTLKHASVAFFRLYGEPDNAVVHKTVKKGKTTVEVGALPKLTEDGVEVDVVAYATGKGANYRKWKITDVKMDVGGEKLRPAKGDTFWVDTGAAKTKSAAVVMTVINTATPGESSAPAQAPQGGSCAPGQPCGPAGGGSSSQGAPASQKRETSEADRIAASAAMGLLVSQAGGEISGQKNSFIINKDLAKKINPDKDCIKVTAENVNTKKKIKVSAKMPEMFHAIQNVSQMSKEEIGEIINTNIGISYLF